MDVDGVSQAVGDLKQQLPTILKEPSMTMTLSASYVCGCFFDAGLLWMRPSYVAIRCHPLAALERDGEPKPDLELRASGRARGLMPR